MDLADRHQHGSLADDADGVRIGDGIAPAAIDSGAKRHFEKTKLQLIAAGFELMPVDAQPRCSDGVASK